MSYRSALILLFCIFAVGCRTDPNRVLQERELRLMEDRIFQLEECVREYQAALAVSERDNLHLRRGLSSSAEPRQGSGSRRLRESPAATPPSNGRAAPRDVDRTGPETAPPSRGPLAPPRVEIDGVDETSPEVPGRSGPSSGSSGPSRDRSERTLPPAGGRIGRNSSSPGAYMPPLEDDAKVAQVTLVKTSTGGYDAESAPGDEGVTVVLRPLDETGALIRAAAPVAVVVMDPELPGEAARVARWDFSAEEVAKSFARLGSTEGIHLTMRWPDAPPIHPDLMLFIRYTTRDGRHLETHQTIRINPPSEANGTGQRKSLTDPADETRIDPPSRPWHDGPRRIVPHRLPADGVAGGAREVPEVATKPEHSLPSWSPNR